MRSTKTGQFASRDFTGFRSGMLTMIRPTGERDKWGYALWEVACDCGNTITRSCQKFTLAKPMKSCGCGPRGRTPKQTHLAALFKKHRLNALSRGFAFELDMETHERLVLSSCTYCGAEPVDRPHPYMKVRITSNTIDRQDSSQGYTVGNCVPACATCNTAKLNMSVDQFRAWIARAYAHTHL